MAATIVEGASSRARLTKSFSTRTTARGSRRSQRTDGPLHALRPQARGPLHTQPRAHRRPRAGRVHRPSERDRQVRSRAVQELHRVCRADDPRRAQAPLSRQGMADPRPARAPGTGASRQPSRRTPVRRACVVPQPLTSSLTRSTAQSRRQSKRSTPARTTSSPRSTRLSRGTTNRTALLPTCWGPKTKGSSSPNSDGRSRAAGPSYPAGTTNTRPAPGAWAHPAPNQPANRIFANARLPSVAPIHALTQRHRGTSDVCMKAL